MSPARVIGMMTARDEEDILAESLAHAASSYDSVLVVDCGSEDRTAEIARDISRSRDNVHFLGSIAPSTPEQVKRHIWNSFRRRIGWADWWCFADADEFIDEGYRSVIESPEVSYCDHIVGEHVNFYYKVYEYERECQQPIEALRSQSIRERRRFYRYHTKQIRFFRNLPWLRWNQDSAAPRYLSYPAPLRIRFYHYQYRDPQQLRTRIEIRRKEYHRSDPSNKHWLKDSAHDALSDDADPSLTLLEDFGAPVKDRALESNEKKQPVAKTLVKYSVNIARGFATPSFRDKRFDCNL